MRVMSFNIQHGLAYLEQKINLNLFASTIKENMVDVCGLNEVRNTGADCEYTDQTGAIAEKLGYNSYFGQAISIDNKNPYGNAVVSRYPFIKTSTILIPNPEKRDEPVYYETRCVIHAVVNINNVNVHLLICHMGLAISERKNAVEILCNIIDGITEPLIVMGDFNDIPTSTLFVELRERLLDTADFFSEANNLTFPSYNPEKKIDYIFYRGLKCNSAKVVSQIVSDHFPIVADFLVE